MTRHATNATRTTPTSYALLGLLAIRPSTAYELTRQMRRALRWAWLRSEANLYHELKRLGALGFVSAVEERTGQRARTRYEITGPGRAALHEWLADGSPTPPRLELELALRVLFADQGSEEDLRRTIRTTREQVSQVASQIAPTLEEYARGEAAFPERFHLNMLFAGFVAGFYELVVRWCEDVERELERWESTDGVGETPGTREMLEGALAFYRSMGAR
ncbi:MAG: PadR family transcriptional regulator [Acidimicrobiia bacterium]|nr:PadR family transcriptional regulator [Acidimicrobiia bacterium]